MQGLSYLIIADAQSSRRGIVGIDCTRSSSFYRKKTITGTKVIMNPSQGSVSVP